MKKNKLKKRGLEPIWAIAMIAIALAFIASYYLLGEKQVKSSKQTQQYIDDEINRAITE